MLEKNGVAGSAVKTKIKISSCLYPFISRMLLGQGDCSIQTQGRQWNFKSSWVMWWMRGQQTESFTLNGISELPLSTGVSGNSRSRPFPRMEGSDSRSQIMGMDFFPPFPFQNFGNAFFIPFPFPNYGNVFFHSLSVPELWEWIFLIPFRLPKLLSHRRESKQELDYCKRYQASNFFSFLYISQNNYIEEVNWAKMFKSEWLNSQMSFPLTLVIFRERPGM